MGASTSDTSKEIRYRVWWSLYTLEHLLTVMTGRPSCVIDSSCTTPMPVPFDESDFQKEEVARLISTDRRSSSMYYDQMPASNSAEDRESTAESESNDAPAESDIKMNRAEYLKSLPPCISFYFLQLSSLTSISKRMTVKLYSPEALQSPWASTEFTIQSLMLEIDSWFMNLPPAYDFTSTQTSQCPINQRMGLVQKALGVPWVSYADWLPCDRTVVMPVAYGGDDPTLRSHTAVTARDAGWSWELDLQSRRGTGYASPRASAATTRPRTSCACSTVACARWPSRRSRHCAPAMWPAPGSRTAWGAGCGLRRRGAAGVHAAVHGGVAAADLCRPRGAVGQQRRLPHAAEPAGGQLPRRAARLRRGALRAVAAPGHAVLARLHRRGDRAAATGRTAGAVGHQGGCPARRWSRSPSASPPSSPARTALIPTGSRKGTGCGRSPPSSTTTSWPVRRLPQMLNPIKNALVMAEIYQRQGIQAWYGTKYVTNWNEHYTGRLPLVNLKSVLGLPSTQTEFASTSGAMMSARRPARLLDRAEHAGHAIAHSP